MGRHTYKPVLTGLLRTYALLGKANAVDREPYLDKLMNRRDEPMTEKSLKPLMAS